jgi:hypothetical protein
MSGENQDGGPTMRSGLDLDGVLGDHVAILLPRILQRHGVALARAGLTSWTMRIGATSSLSEEILAGFTDPSFVMSMPMCRGARGLLRAIAACGASACVVTSRPPACRATTLAWITHKRLEIEEVAFLPERTKSGSNVDILVDDYHGNVEEFLSGTEGAAILLRRPWSGQLSTEWTSRAGSRLVLADSVLAAAMALPALVAAQPRRRQKASSAERA